MTVEDCVLCGRALSAEMAFISYWAIIGVLFFAAAAVVGALAFVALVVWRRVGHEAGW